MDGPLLVLAGPGSGKTRVITRRIGYLAASGIAPQQILAITFTNKAAGEMRERVEAMGAASGAWVSTFHSFCARMLRAHARRVGRTPSFSICDTADSVAAVKRAIQELAIDPALYKPGKLAKQISAAKNRLHGPEQVAKYHQPEAATLSRIYERYQKILQSSNAADFDDLLLLVVELFKNEPEIAARLRGRFRYVLIDEYQDTNRAQYLIAHNLAAEHNNICATGDPDQSIYGWRGAELSNILEFERNYPAAKVVRLERNYRSTKKILRAAAGLIANNVARKQKDLWTENADGELVSILRAEDEEEEAHLIAEDIARRVRAGEVAPKDVAVFYRVNAQSRAIEAAFRDETLPYVIVAGTEFYQRAEVKDLLAYLRLVVNPDDDISAERVMNVPTRGLGSVSVNRIKACAASKGRTLMNGLAHAQEAGVKGPGLEGAAAFLNVFDKLRAMPPHPVASVVETLIHCTAFEKHLLSKDKADDRIANARELVNAAAEYDRAEPDGDLGGFLEQAALISDTDRWEVEKGSVTLMTLHAAKGLEFPAVYIVGLEEGLLPLAGNGADHNVEEERRLFFVGITRAMRTVTVSFAESRARYGKRDFTKPSRFLFELPEAATSGRPEAAAPPRWRRERSRSVRRVRRTKTEEIIYDGESPLDDPPFQRGDMVEHPTFGRGKVLEISGFGEDMRARVRFHSVGLKLLVLKFIRLRKV